MGPTVAMERSDLIFLVLHIFFNVNIDASCTFLKMLEHDHIIRSFYTFADSDFISLFDIVAFKSAPGVFISTKIKHWV